MMLLLLLLLPFAAHAEEDVDLIIDVVASEDAARQDLHEELRSLGYRPPKRRRDRVVYHNHKLSRPSVHVLHDGRVFLKRAPIHVGMPGGSRSTQQVCAAINLPSAGDGRAQQAKGVCLYLDGMLTGSRHMRLAKVRTMAAIADEIIEWREAYSTARHAEYVALELPKRMAEMWRAATSPAAGTEALHDHFCTRTDTDAGATAREAVQTFARTVELVGPHADSDGWNWPCDQR